uniref:Uncharacterized protein n=1 Tax=Anguilla anguilla TaxID=7936 RepID=A0A0E9WVK5_ANGAN
MGDLDHVFKILNQYTDVKTAHNCVAFVHAAETEALQEFKFQRKGSHFHPPQR